MEVGIQAPDDPARAELGTAQEAAAEHRLRVAVAVAERLLGAAASELRPLFAGASGKQVTRVAAATRSLVVVTSADDAALDALERRTAFLAAWEVPVPTVLARTAGGVVLEDGGRQLLAAATDADADRLWPRAVEILAKLAAVPVAAFAEHCGGAPRVFDRANLLFDLRYFDQHVLGAGVAALLPHWPRSGVGRWPESTCARVADVTWSWLADQPQVVMHRDFQSTNLVVDGAGTLRLVDLDSLRVGCSVYDLASLAFDIALPPDERRLELLSDAFFARFPEVERPLLWGAAWLRLLQATATAYRFAGERPFFATALPTALDHLHRVMVEPAAAGLLSQLPAEVTDRLAALLEVTRGGGATAPGSTGS